MEKSTKNGLIKFLIIVVISLGIAITFVTGYVQPMNRLTFVSMNTNVEILIYDRFFGDVNQANLDVSNLFRTLDSLWNPYDTNSEITAINNGAGKGVPTKIDENTFELISEAITFHNNYSEKFDITVGPLIKLWKEAGKKNELPCNCNITRIQKELMRVDKIKLDSTNQTVYLENQGMKLDFGAIAKGFAQKKVVAIMKKNGIKFYIVNSGGDMYVSSKYYRAFKIGIKDPNNKNLVLKSIAVKNSGVATSGDYERFSMIEGKKYSHIINPITGKPQEEFVSSTVIHKDPLMADIWATTLSIERDSTLFNKFPKDMGGYILIEKNGEFIDNR